MYLNLTLTEIIAIVTLVLVAGAFVFIPYSFEGDKKRDPMLNFSFFVILILTVGSLNYKKTRESIIEGFYNEKELLCKKESEEKFILSQAKGFTLQSDYFIHDEHIIYIGGCMLLQEHNKTIKGNNQ